MATKKYYQKIHGKGQNAMLGKWVMQAFNCLQLQTREKLQEDELVMEISQWRQPDQAAMIKRSGEAKKKVGEYT